MKKLALVTLLLLIVSNGLWAYHYRKLWYDCAQAEGSLDEATDYIHAGCSH
jgi:hypothetical protein